METKNLELTTSFQLVGAGPLLLTLEAGAIAQIHIADSIPAADAAVRHMRFGDASQTLTYNGNQNVYAKKSSGYPGTVIVAWEG